MLDYDNQILLCDQCETQMILEYSGTNTDPQGSGSGSSAKIAYNVNPNSTGMLPNEEITYIYRCPNCNNVIYSNKLFGRQR